jgi:hypothetical protein
MSQIPRTLTLAALALAGCSGSATVRLALENETGASAAALAAPEPARTFRMKLVAVYVAEDVDPVTQDNVGRTSMVWLNPECHDDIGSCTPSGTPGGGPRITGFFDFSPPTDVVNAALNAQGRDVEAGTYRYARVEFCKYSMPEEPNLLWSGPGMTEERAMTVGDCGRTSQPFDPPLELADGDSVTVTLAYDLARSIVSGAPDPASGMRIVGDGRWFRDCADVDGETRACMDVPEFVPSASK